GGVGPLSVARRVKEALGAIGRLRAFLHPCLDFFQIELEPLGLLFRQQRIEIAEPFNEAAVAWCTIVGDDNVIDRALFCAGTGKTNNKRHSSVLSSYGTGLLLLSKTGRQTARQSGKLSAQTRQTADV